MYMQASMLYLLIALHARILLSQQHMHCNHATVQSGDVACCVEAQLANTCSYKTG